MHDDDAAAQPDPGPRRRHPRRWRAWWRRGGARRTVLGHGPGVGADRFDPSLTDFMGDTAWLIGQPVPVASLSDAVIDVSSCMVPAWPSASTGRRKESRPLHPTAPRPNRRRLQRTSGAGRGRPTTRQSGHPGGGRTDTLSGASDTMGGDSGDGDGPAGSHGADSTGVGVAQPLRGRVRPPPASPRVSPPPRSQAYEGGATARAREQQEMRAPILPDLAAGFDALPVADQDRLYTQVAELEASLR